MMNLRDQRNEPGRTRNSRGGAVLLAVLVAIVVLSAVLVQFIDKGMAEISVEGHYVERDRLRLDAFSALETTLAVLADVTAVEGGLTAPAQGWADPLGVSGVEFRENLKVTVSFADESGKLPLNGLDEGTLYLLFDSMGFSIDDGLKLTSSLLDWVDADDESRIDGAESNVYGLAEWPYQASNQPMRRLSELSVVDGFQTLFFDASGRPNEYFRTFASTMSPYADGILNVNSVSDLALRAYAGFGDAQIQAIHTYLWGADGIAGTDDDRYFASNDELTLVLGELPEGVRLGVEARILRIRVQVEEGDAHYVLEAVVQRAQGGGNTNPRQAPAAGAVQSTSSTASPQISYPFVFLELKEDVGQNDSVAAPAEELEVPMGSSAHG